MPSDQEVTDRVLTLANVVTFVRLCMVPATLAVLLAGHDVAAAVMFGATAATDFLDGQIARRTNTVSRVGQLLDPAVDRLLVVCAVLGLLAVGRLPLWIAAVVLLRDLLLLCGGSWLLRKYRVRVPVVYPGKVATTLLFAGLAGLMLNVPQVPGLGWCDLAWLPGFNSVPSSWGIWLIYPGLCLAIGTTIYYVATAWKRLVEAKNSDGR